MASPVHSSAPEPLEPQQLSTPSSSTSTGPRGPRGRRAKRKRLATNNDETDNNNNNEHTTSSSDETIEVNCDAVLANHLRHMEAREQFDEFQGQLPLRCKPMQLMRRSDRSSQR